MNKFKLSFLGILALVGLFAGGNINTASAQTATPTCTNAVWSAVLDGTVFPNGISTQAWFEWGPTTSLQFSTPSQTFTTTSNFSQTLTPLNENTTYYFRAMAQNQHGIAEGSIKSFSTGVCAQPVQTYTVSTNAGPGGNISPSSRQVTAGDTTIFSVTPNSGYSISSASGCNGFLSGNTYTTGTITSNCTVFASFSANPVQTCQDPNATNFGGSLPCTYPSQPSVNLTADQTSVSFNGSTTLRWNSNNATSCSASGGTNGWSGPKSIGSNNSFHTGALTNTITYHITCSNGSGSASDSVTVSVGNQPVSNPTVSLTADQTSVSFNGSTILRWTSNNAVSCNASGGTNGWSGPKPIGSNNSFHTGALTNTITYNITCTGSTGQQAFDSVTVSVGNQPAQTCQDPNATNFGGALPCNYQNLQPSVNLTADDTSIDFNDNTILRWTSNNAVSCNASGGTNGWSGPKSIGSNNSFHTGNLTSDRSYSITCTSSTGAQAFDSVTVRVDDEDQDEDAPRVDLRADNSSVSFNGSTFLRWTSDNADTCRATSGTNGWSGRQNRSGSFHTGALTSDTTYRITCENDSGDDTDSVTVRVDNNQNVQQRCLDVNAINYNSIGSCVYRTVSNQPTVAIFADSTNIAFNSSTNVYWGSTNATSCFASGGSTGWAGTKSIGPGAFFTGSLTGSRTYTITCSNNVGSATDSVTVNVRGQVLGTTTVARPAPTSLVLVTSSVDRNQPIVPTLDNTNPCPGDEINYTVTYQNIGTGAVTNLVLRLDLPNEVDYMFSNPNNPTRSGNTLIFSLGTLRANGQGTVTVRVRVRDNVPAGMHLNFPATLSYVDPSGFPQSVHANISAQICSALVVIQDDANRVLLGANIFGSGGFMPGNIFGWLLLLILILLLILLAKYIFGQPRQPVQPYVLQSAAPVPNHPRKTTTTTVEEH